MQVLGCVRDSTTLARAYSGVWVLRGAREQSVRSHLNILWQQKRARGGSPPSPPICELYSRPLTFATAARTTVGANAEHAAHARIFFHGGGGIASPYRGNAK